MTTSRTIRQQLEEAFVAAVEQAFPALGEIGFEIYKPREKAFGDFATNAAMIAGKALKANPVEVAREIVGKVQVPSPLIASIDVAKPGFINIVVAHDAYIGKLKETVTCENSEAYGFTDIGHGERVQVEFVSANPTGPLNVVSARAAAVGDALVNLLARIGYDVKSEFYVNDSGTQVELLGESLRARFREVLGEKLDLPEGGYPGEYLSDIAKKVKTLADGTNNRMAEERATGLLPAPQDERKHADQFLESTIEKGTDEARTKKTYTDDYLAFSETLPPDQRALWMPLYICRLSNLGLTFSEMLDRLLWIEQFRSHLEAQATRGGVSGKAETISAESFFLGQTVKGVSFDFARFAVAEIVEMQKESLSRFGNRPEGGVRFDRWFRESELEGDIEKVSKKLTSDGRFVVEKEGAMWLKGGEGEEDEWVLTRSTGQPTYFLSDITYHIDKRKRGFDQVIDIWGPDHHGHIARMQAAIKVASLVIPDLEIPEDWLRVLIAQQVNLIREGKRVQMSKRAGEYVTLDDILVEIAPDPKDPKTGADVARFFFLLRRCNSHLDFDLDLAKRMSEENPVYYVQYAHARISSIIEFARQSGYEEMPPQNADLSLLASDEEMEVMKSIADFDDLVAGSALALEPHRIPIYLIDLAGKFHRFYHNHRVVTDDRAMSGARLYLCYAVRTILRSGLSLIGVSAPTSM